MSAAVATPPAGRRYLGLLLKLTVMAGALLLVARRLDLPTLLGTLRAARPGWLALATALFVASKWLSARRLNQFFREVNLPLSEEANLRLYWRGMFYNLFLPGGVGGDGYKVYRLGQRFPGRRTLIFRALLLDRLSGLVALLTWLLLGLALAERLPPGGRLAALLALPLGLGLSYWLGGKWFREFRGAFARTWGPALGVQGAQVLCAAALLAALGAPGPGLPYLLVFLASSVAAVLPLTVGGLGLRELTFLYGAQLFQLNPAVAVSVSLLFYVITAAVSLVGAGLRQG